LDRKKFLFTLKLNKMPSKEMLINAGITLVVVMIGLAVHDKFVAPKLKK